MSTRKMTLFLGALAVAGVLTGCGGPARLFIKATACINPPTDNCPGGDFADSRLLETRIYQIKDDPNLKSEANLCALKWNDFVEGKEVDGLKDKLTDSQHLDLVRNTLLIQPRDDRALEPWTLLPDTKYLLVVTVGRNKGHNSVRILPASQARKGARLYFHGYDVCIDHPCETSAEKVCP